MYSQIQEVKKSCRIGDNVKYNGRDAVIFNMAGDMVHLKFADGEMIFVSHDEVQHVLNLSTLKACPFCKGESKPLAMEARQTNEEVYHCMKCSSRFSIEVKGGSF